MGDSGASGRGPRSRAGESRTLGLLHPGAMGASVGAALVAGGARVLWSAEGRSDATRARAEQAGLVARDDLGALAGECDGIVSVCPPTAAIEVARSVASSGFAGVYVDGNAVSPATARAIDRLFADAPADFVDGGIIGPPAWRAGTTRLHLSGERASEVAGWLDGSPLEVLVVPGPPGRASALKMVFAAWTKGTSALLASIYATARVEGVDREILAEWEKALPDLPGRLRAGVPASAVKGWRFAGEMREIADTFEAAGLPGGFHRAAADLFERLADFRDADPAPTADEVAAELVGRPGSTG